MNKFVKSIALIAFALALVVVGASSASAAFSRSLTIGSSGADVSCASTTSTVPGCMPGYMYIPTTGALCSGGTTGGTTGGGITTPGVEGTIAVTQSSSG